MEAGKRIQRRWCGLLALISATLVAALCVVAVGAPASASIGVNDYPSNLRTAPQDSIVDPWSFYNRECTSFVAWRINNDNHVSFTNNMNGEHWGNAYEWRANAIKLGYAVNSTPTVGAIAWWGANQNGAGSAGHVAYVMGVNSDGSVDTEDYNSTLAGAYATHRYAANGPSRPVAYIHVGSAASASSGGGVQGMQFVGSFQLTQGQRMYPNQYLLSFDTRWVLALQGDGNLVLYGPGYVVRWSSGTAGRPVSHLIVQDDGNVVMYGSQGAVWSTGTAGTAGAVFKVQDDGNIVVYNGAGGARWSIGAKGTSTGGSYIGTDARDGNEWLRPNQFLKSSDNRYALYLQGDGNLVLWSPGGRQQWATGGGRTNVSGVIQQNDGNLVLYANPVWASNSVSSGSFRLKLQNDGNLVVYNTTTGIAIWSSGTAGRI